MPNTTLTFIKGDEVSSDTDYRDALPVNMYAVQRSILGSQGYMYSHEGLTSFSTGTGIDRGGYWNGRFDLHYRVSGDRLLLLGSDGATSDQGEITGTKRVSLTHSFNTQAIVADGRMWLHNGTALSEVTDPDLGDPIDITWIDGYYFLTDGEFLYHTELGDETAISPLSFATSEFSPDPTLAVERTSDNQVIVFNRFTTEYFVNRALKNFAFQRVSGKTVKVGVVGTHAETELDGRFYVLGGGREESPSIHYISSGTYKSVASREVDKIIAEYNETELADAVLETRVKDKVRFIVVRLPRHTLLYNANIAESIGVDFAWSIVRSGITADTKWRGVNGVYDPRISSWVYGDNQNSNIGLLDESIATQYGNKVENILFTPLADLDSASIDKIEVDTLPGHQVNSDDVTCAISLTYDGVTYGKEWWNLYGQQYNYGTRFIARRLGYVRDYVGFKVRHVGAERISMLALQVDYG